MAVDQGAKFLRFAVLTPGDGSTEIINRPIIAEAPIAIEYIAIVININLCDDCTPADCSQNLIFIEKRANAIWAFAP